MQQVDGARTEFRHADLDDPFIMYVNLAACLVRTWGVSMFFLIILSMPAGLLLLAVSTVIAGLGDWAAANPWIAILWFALSVPIAVLDTVLRWRQLERNLVAVSPAGIEYRWYPWRSRAVPWAEVRVVRDPFIPSDEDSPTNLVIETGSGDITLEAEDWPIARIGPAIEPYFKITRDRDQRAAAGS